jgi:hypothetical protein
MKTIKFTYTLSIDKCDIQETYFINKNNVLEFLGHSEAFYRHHTFCVGYNKCIVNCDIQKNKFFDFWTQCDIYKYSKIEMVSQHYVNNVNNDFFFDGKDYWENKELYVEYLIDEYLKDYDYWINSEFNGCIAYVDYLKEKFLADEDFKDSINKIEKYLNSDKFLNYLKIKFSKINHFQ